MTVNKLVIIGFGLIGASVAAGLRGSSFCRSIVAVSRTRETCDQALKLGLADEASTSIKQVAASLGENDLVCVSVPTLSMAPVFEHLRAAVERGATITDCASVKGSVRRAAVKVFGKVPTNLVLGHPIAGSEKSGVGAANPGLYRKHRIILTPEEDTERNALRCVIALWESLGAEVVEMSVEEHDDVLAATSHLPHVIAYSLVDTLAHDAENDNIFRYAAGGFRDFTRIASSDPRMWHDIMLANRESILKALDLFADNLQQVRQAIAEQDSDFLMGMFSRSKTARDTFVTGLHKSVLVPEPEQSGGIRYVASPGGTISGKLRVPGDKSISHRAIMLGSLARGVTQVSGFLEGEDALATIRAFRDMGVSIVGPEQGNVTIHGVGLHGLQAPASALNLGNSGTSMRLLSGLMAGQAFDVVLSGDESLSRRPMKRIIGPLSEMGAAIESEEGGRAPLRISGGCKLKAIDYTLPMASAQVKSAVLLAGLYAKGKTRVTEPAVTRDHTERMLQGFGYPVTLEGEQVSLSGGGELTATNIEVPADISSAAFFMVAASIAPGSDVTLTHVGINPTRTGVLNILRLMGADIGFNNKREVGGEPVADIRVRYSPLRGVDIPPELVPLAIDEFPALFIAAACAEGTTRLTGAEELRVKESDRIQVMADGLQALGVDARPTPDGMTINGGKIAGGVVKSRGDHRIAMAFTIAALRAESAIVIEDCANVATSFPGFTELAQSAGISLEVKST